MEAEPSVQLGTCAVTVTGCGPSIRVLSGTVRLNTADVWPVGMTTVDGTANLELLLEARLTGKFTATTEEALTRPALTRVPAPFVAVAGRVTVNVAVSLSLTRML